MSALLCDVGGTNTRLALAEGGRIVAASARSLRNDRFASFDLLLREYLRDRPASGIRAACIALAAPITPERVKLTNRDWTIERATVAELTGGADVRFINDFEALGFALTRIEELETRQLVAAGPHSEWRARLVLGAGTGFNAAALLRDPTGGFAVAAAECGHMTLPIETADELRLRDYLAEGRGRASVERVLSGRGIAEIHAWCRGRPREEAQETRPADIVASAAAGEDDAAVAACRIVLRFFGRVAGDLALAYLPRGGLYLAGGVSRAVVGLMAGDDGFAEAFHGKGRMRRLMEDFPISLVSDDRTALSGCLAWLETRAPGTTGG